MPDRERTVRAVMALVCCICVAIPFLVVQVPPITDLPQQTAQIRLFLDALNNPGSAYRIQWFTPYSVSYALLGLGWALFGPEGAGRMATLVVGLLWTVAVHGLAAKRRRPAAAAVLASLLFFNSAVYWGFFSFAVGWPAFVLWLLVTARTRAAPLRPVDVVMLSGAALLLYMSHALWFGAGMLWLLVSSVRFPVVRRVALMRLASVVPVLVAAAVWYPQLSAAGFVSSTVWADTPTGRVSFSWLVDAAFGGLYGPTEYAVAGALTAWVLVALWQHRAAARNDVDAELLFAAALFLVSALFLPDQHMNTIQFAARWVPPGMILLVLAVPAPVFDVALQRVVSLAVVAVFCLSTALAWMRFERVEMSGLREALETLPATSRVLGLDFVKDSAVIKGRPFMQAFAYAQVLKGGQLNFSFAQFAPSLVVFKERHKQPWTNTLEWFAERVQPADFAYFDYAIINARPDTHAVFSAKSEITPATSKGRWRLYRVTQPVP